MTGVSWSLHLAAGSPRLHLMAALDELLMDFVFGSLPFVRIVPIRFVRPAISTGGAITLAEACINVIKRDPADRMPVQRAVQEFHADRRQAQPFAHHAVRDRKSVV